MSSRAFPILLLLCALMPTACTSAKEATEHERGDAQVGAACVSTSDCIAGAHCNLGLCTTGPCSGAMMRQSPGFLAMSRTRYEYDALGREVGMWEGSWTNGQLEWRPVRTTQYPTRRTAARTSYQPLMSSLAELALDAQERILLIENRDDEAMQIRFEYDDKCAYYLTSTIRAKGEVLATTKAECKDGRPILETSDGEEVRHWTYDDKGRVLEIRSPHFKTVKRFSWFGDEPGPAVYEEDRGADGTLEEHEVLDYSCVHVEADGVRFDEVSEDHLPPLLPGRLARWLTGEWFEASTGDRAELDLAAGRLNLVIDGRGATYAVELVVESPMVVGLVAPASNRSFTLVPSSDRLTLVIRTSDSGAQRVMSLERR
ncbi:MAG: hypothetical protein COW42_16555 [Deltaproteobacteria bacterium CG17_big_fil_post_rev_8_21_14_2_50_63_7]|nr:MAG: hypothetical protein COW42_16555 [Deltaproteobacteria bacterium CG17_big_fil_post_rev_8_21_14_2_50_63_7]